MKNNIYFICAFLISIICCNQNIDFNRTYYSTKNINKMHISRSYNFFPDSTYLVFGYITQYRDTGRLSSIDRKRLILCPIIVKMPIKYDLKINNNNKLNKCSVEFEFDSTLLERIDIYLYINNQSVRLMKENKVVLNDIDKKDTLNIKFIPKLGADVGYSLKNQAISSENIIMENNFNQYKIEKITYGNYYNCSAFSQDLRNDTILVKKNKFILINNNKKYTYYAFKAKSKVSAHRTTTKQK
jgi:hypothetical protein